MLEAEVKSWVLTVVDEVLVKVADDGLRPTFHGDLLDDSVGDSPGRIASFEVEGGKLQWWNWRAADACARAAWPLKLRLEFGDGEHRTVWIHDNSWNLDRADLRSKVVRM